MPGEQKPAWGMLYLWSGLMFGALIGEHGLRISHNGHKLLEICVILVWGVIVARWHRHNRVALEAMVEQQVRARRTSEQHLVEVELTPVQAHYRQVMEESTSRK